MAAARERVGAFEHDDPDLKAYLARMVTRLEVLFDNPPDDPDAGWILGGVFHFLLPALDLDWLPDEPRKESELTEVLRASHRSLAQQRRQLAFENSFLAPGPGRYQLAVIDLLLETLQILVYYPDEDLKLGCVAVLGDMLNALWKPKDAQEPSPGWVC